MVGLRPTRSQRLHEDTLFSRYGQLYYRGSLDYYDILTVILHSIRLSHMRIYQWSMISSTVQSIMYRI